MVQAGDHTRIRVLLLDLGQEMRGGQRQVFYLVRALEALREHGEPVEAVVACPTGSGLAGALAEAELPFVPLPGRSLVNPLVLYTLRKAIHRRGINILHTHDARAATLGNWFKRWNPGLRLIHARRVSYPLREGMRGKKYLAADALIGVSHEISRGMLASGLPESKVFTIHSGIDPARYTPKTERHDGRFVFGAVGALTEQKGFGVLIQAMSVLAEMDDLPPWEVRIVGEGPLFHELLAQAGELGMAERLALFGRQESTDFLPQFDVLLVPSINGEGSNAVIKEGWAVGLPVVCSALPGNEELVKDKENGLVVPKGNPLALATAMLRLMREPDLGLRLVQAGARTLQLYTDRHMAARTYLVYQAVLRAYPETYAKSFNNELGALTLPEFSAGTPIRPVQEPGPSSGGQTEDADPAVEQDVELPSLVNLPSSETSVTLVPPAPSTLLEDEPSK